MIGRAALRMGRAAGLVTIGYAVFLGFWLRDNAEPQASSPLPGWLALSVLIAVPGAVALVAVAGRSGWLLLEAGVMCLLQSFISFAGVTLPFLAPAVLLLAAASGTGRRVRAAQLPGAVTATLAWLAAWAFRLELLGGGRDVTRSGIVLVALAAVAVAAPLLLAPDPTSEAWS